MRVRDEHRVLPRVILKYAIGFLYIRKGIIAGNPDGCGTGVRMQAEDSTQSPPSARPYGSRLHLSSKQGLTR